MATSIRSSSSNNSTTGTAMSVSTPVGTIAGDLVIISVHGNGQTTIVDNNGTTPFTEDLNDFQPNPTGGHTVSIFSRRILLGDPTTYNFTLGASSRWSIVAVTLSSPHPNTIYDVAPSTTNAGNTDDSAINTQVTPSISPTSKNAIVFVCGYSDDPTGGSPTPPSTYIQVQGPVDEPQGVAVKVVSYPSTTGVLTYTFTTNAPRIALSFAIRDFGKSASFYHRSLRPRVFAPGLAR